MKFPERVRVATTGVGKGLLTMAPAAVSPEYRTVAAAGLVAGDTFPYSIGVAGSTEWESGIATITTVSNGTVTFARAVTVSSNGNLLVDFSAGAKEVICTPLGSSLFKFEQGTSARMVFMSNICASDTVLKPYAQKEGADQRAKAQAVLDLAKTLDALNVIWDVKATLANVPNSDGDTLLLSSNTKVVALHGCGALQAAGSKGDMWKNANPTTNQNNNHASIVDENITIDGGVWHGNREGQTVKMDVFRFSGVRNLKTVNHTIYRPSGMCERFINIDGHTHGAYILDQGVDIMTAPNSVLINTDGAHWHGPLSDLYDFDGQILNCGDDAFALNADDAWGAGTFTGRFDNVFGPINRVLSRNLRFKSRYFGIRILSGNSRVDRVRFETVRGSTSGSAFRVDNYVTPSQLKDAGPGNCGLIEVDGWDVETAAVNFDWGQMAMEINGRVEQLSLRNIVKRDFNTIYFPTIRFGEKYQGDQLEVRLRSRNYTGSGDMTNQIDFLSGAKLMQGSIKVQTISATAVSGSPVRVQSGASIGVLDIDGQATNFTSMVQAASGAISTMRDRTVASSVVAAPSTFTLQDSSYWIEDTSNPSILTFKGAHAGVVHGFKKNTADAYGGNVTVSDTLTWTGTNAGTGLHHALGCRASNIVPWGSSRNGYFFDAYTDNVGSGFKLFKSVNGVDTTLASVNAALAIGSGYKASLTAKNSAISLVVQRTSDGFYLTGAGAWQAGAATALSVTDTSIPAASGEWGGYAYNENNTQIVTTISNIAIAAAP